jgi:hypothetical protein
MMLAVSEIKKWKKGASDKVGAVYYRDLDEEMEGVIWVYIPTPTARKAETSQNGYSKVTLMIRKKITGDMQWGQTVLYKNYRLHVLWKRGAELLLKEWHLFSRKKEVS